MEFNVEKCKVTHVGGRNSGFKYKMAGQDLGETELDKDLGVLVSDNLKPSAHCSKAAKKANAVLGQITRACMVAMDRGRLRSAGKVPEKGHKNDVRRKRGDL